MADIASELTPISGLRIKESEMLAGYSKAVKQGGVVYVSPAVYSLIKTSSPEELVELAKSLKFVDLDPPLHDADWWKDTAQILAAWMNRTPFDAAKKEGRS